MTDKKTSQEWTKHYPNLSIMDPDGWDRKNYDYSFNQEEITKEEFERRLSLSTCFFTGKREDIGYKDDTSN